MAWFWLIAGGVLEVTWAVGFKFVKGFSTPFLLVSVLSSMALSILCYWIAVKTVPVGTAYAVWTGIGASGAVLVGIMFLGEPASIVRLACIALIILGIVGLKVFA